MNIETKEQYDSLKGLLGLLWEGFSMPEASTEINDLWNDDFELCGECDHTVSDCECRYGASSGREYDDGDSFES